MFIKKDGAQFVPLSFLAQSRIDFNQDEMGKDDDSPLSAASDKYTVIDRFGLQVFAADGNMSCALLAVTTSHTYRSDSYYANVGYAASLTWFGYLNLRQAV